MPIYDLWQVLPEPDEVPSLPVQSAVIRSMLVRRGVRNADEYRRFVAAAKEVGAIGISMYDYRVTAANVWPILARG